MDRLINCERFIEMLGIVVESTTSEATLIVSWRFASFDHNFFLSDHRLEAVLGAWVSR